mmetsp:Transcript_27255/g.78278  ORF Transcript_27255/g.78278 Transcript_27255/m.78278 type:complete len:98 (+) Transcript_27255:250-543(+)
MGANEALDKVPLSRGAGVRLDASCGTLLRRSWPPHCVRVFWDRIEILCGFPKLAFESRTDLFNESESKSWSVSKPKRIQPHFFKQRIQVVVMLDTLQ